MILALVAISALVIYPSWNYVDDDGHKQNLGHGLIWKPPVAKQKAEANILGFAIDIDLDSKRANSIDMGLLLLQVSAVAVVALGLTAVLKAGGKTA